MGNCRAVRIRHAAAVAFDNSRSLEKEDFNALSVDIPNDIMPNAGIISSNHDVYAVQSKFRIIKMDRSIIEFLEECLEKNVTEKLEVPLITLI